MKRLGRVVVLRPQRGQDVLPLDDDLFQLLVASPEQDPPEEPPELLLPVSRVQDQPVGLPPVPAPSQEDILERAVEEGLLAALLRPDPDDGLGLLPPGAGRGRRAQTTASSPRNTGLFLRLISLRIALPRLNARFATASRHRLHLRHVTSGTSNSIGSCRVLVPQSRSDPRLR